MSKETTYIQIGGEACYSVPKDVGTAFKVLLNEMGFELSEVQTDDIIGRVLAIIDQYTKATFLPDGGVIDAIEDVEGLRDAIEDLKGGEQG